MVDDSRRAAQDDSYSYRDFNLGGTILAINDVFDESGLISTIGGHELGDVGIEFMSAGNTKRQPKQKVCLEKKLDGQVRKAGLTRVIGLVIAATTDEQLIEEVSDYRTPTLLPCVPCHHEVLSGHRFRDDTLILTTGLEKDHYQVTMAGELMRIYREGDVEALMGRPVISGFKHWERRVKMYEQLSIAERVATDAKRSPAMLAQMALQS